MPSPCRATRLRDGAAWNEPAHLVSNGPFYLAGWQAGKALTLERNPDYHLPVIELWGGEGSGAWGAVSEYLAQQWQRVLGVNSQRCTVAAERLIRYSGAEGPHAFFVGWRADYPDPDNFLRLAPIGWQTGWRHAHYDDLVTRAKTLRDATERLRLYREAETILAQEAPILPLTYHHWYALFKPRVTHFPISPMRRWFLKDVVITPD